MSISPIGGVSAAHGSAVPPSAAKPEAAEVKGAVDHDGDADNGAAKAAPKGAPAAATVNVKG